jgi:hypothetical protein
MGVEAAAATRCRLKVMRGWLFDDFLAFLGNRSVLAVKRVSWPARDADRIYCHWYLIQ